LLVQKNFKYFVGQPHLSYGGKHKNILDRHDTQRVEDTQSAFTMPRQTDNLNLEINRPTSFDGQRPAVRSLFQID
jgi:hypothetical protein